MHSPVHTREDALCASVQKTSAECKPSCANGALSMALHIASAAQPAHESSSYQSVVHLLQPMRTMGTPRILAIMRQDPCRVLLSDSIGGDESFPLRPPALATWNSSDSAGEGTSA